MPCLRWPSASRCSITASRSPTGLRPRYAPILECKRFTLARSEPTTPNRLAVDRLTAGYGASVAVRQVTLRVGPGEAVALLGRNGAGKSTTLMAIAGALRPMTGSVQIDGQSVAGLPSYRVARSGVSLVPQGRRIFATLSVRENLTLASGSGNLAGIYSLFPALGVRSAAAGSALSGGEQQMLAIGRALMARPRLLLLDEPSEGLAPQVVRVLGDLIARLRHEMGLSILIAEQNLALAFEVADRIYVMERGEVVHEAPAAAFRDDHALQRRYLGV
ncbi:MAG: ABC transporter ATP-binding protein [Chloroflexi bacterium]|nr:MAG: ABC transporter ATP-binding protein [Chloroflexota bacterium]